MPERRGGEAISPELGGVVMRVGEVAGTTGAGDGSSMMMVTVE